MRPVEEKEGGFVHFLQEKETGHLSGASPIWCCTCILCTWSTSCIKVAFDRTHCTAPMACCCYLADRRPHGATVITVNKF